MGVTYTRKEIRTMVNDLTRDTDTGLIADEVKNRIISDIHRDFVERTKCNRNCVIFSLADGTSNGTLEYDMRTSDRLTGNDPTLTYADYEGYPSYKLSNCDAIIKIERYVSSDDGASVELRPVDADDINRLNLLSGTTDYPNYYEMLGESDTFRILPALATSGYTIKYRIWYMESVVDLVTDDTNPADDTAPVFTGSGLDDMTLSTASTALAGTFVVTVGTTGGTDKYTYTRNGVSGGAEADMAATVTLGTGGPVVAFAATTGHTTGDLWTFYQDDPQTGSIPLRFRKAVVWGATAEVLAMRGDERFQYYKQLYENEVERCKQEAYTDTHDKPYRIKVNRNVGQGG